MNQHPSQLELIVRSQNYNVGEYLYDFETDGMVIFNKFVIDQPFARILLHQSISCSST